MSSAGDSNGVISISVGGDAALPAGRDRTGPGFTCRRRTGPPGQLWSAPVRKSSGDHAGRLASPVPGRCGSVRT